MASETVSPHSVSPSLSPSVSVDPMINSSVALMYNLWMDWGIKQSQELSLLLYNNQLASVTSVLILLLSCAFVYCCNCCCCCCYRRQQERRQSKVVPSSRSSEIRKRDLVRHLGRRVMRVGKTRLHEFRRNSIGFRFQPLPPSTSDIQLHREPPAAYLEADLELESQIPHDVMYLLKSVRVFGHFEKPLFMELCKHVETKFVPSGAILFRPGQVDDSIYVVQNGKLHVFLIEQDGTEFPLKDAGTGESVHSLLSLMDAIIGQPHPFRTVSARAVRDTYVLQIRANSFKKFFDENPDSLLRIIQIIMLRLQRVTFLALNQFLGLGQELLIQKVSIPTDLNIYKLKHSFQRTGTNQSLQVDDYETSDTINSFSTQLVGGDSDSEGLTSDGRNSDPPPPPLEVTKYDSTGDESTGKKPKAVAIDTSQNASFTHRLIPAQSPEFDNVINQARVDRMEFGGSQPVKANLIQNVPLRYSHFVSLESNDILQAATADLIKIFQLKDNSLLNGRIQLIEVACNSVLGYEGDLDSCVYFIVSGRIKVFKLHSSKESGSCSHEELLYYAQPGEFVGVLSALTGEPSFISLKAASYSHLIAITKTNLYQILSEHPIAVCGIASDLVRRLSHFVKQMDFALDWMDLEAGKALYRQGEESTVAYIILNGRLRSVVKNEDGKKELADEYGRGETVGVVEVMTKSPRATTVHAIRDTELASVPLGLLNTIKMKKPQVVSRLIQLLGEKIMGSYNRVLSMPAGPTESKSTVELIIMYINMYSLDSTMLSKHLVSNLSTVAVVPISADIPLSHITRHLTAAVNTIVSAKRLTSKLIEEELGTSALESVHEYRLCTWLGHQEDTHKIVIYQANGSLTPWTARCIRQADCILLVGVGDQVPNFNSMGTIVTQVEKISARVRKELVLLHKEGVAHPQGTVQWLNALGWLSSYFHVRCPDEFFTETSSAADERSLPTPPDKHSDIARLARRLTGTSVGLVLGGGGARGLSHCGIIKAFQEAGVPIDMVGGTSIGALVGALYSEECDAGEVLKRASTFSKRMAAYWDKILDLTYPSMSMFTGRAFNTIIYNVFHERHIEDLWLPYYCVTTDVTDSKMRVHTAGCLWRYVRASMSLSGYLPPLCDPVDGHLLLDGGYVNNLPADLMSSQGAEHIIAIDVGSEDNNALLNYGDSISGWRIICNKLNPFSKTMRIPNLTEIQSRLAYVSCVRQLETVKNDSSCEYIRPPIDNIATMQFGSFDEIAHIGYKHCKSVLSSWTKSHTLSHLLTETLAKDFRQKRNLMEPSDSLSRKVPSIHNLAALAAEIPQLKNKETVMQDEDIDGYWSNPEVVPVSTEEPDEEEEDSYEEQSLKKGTDTKNNRQQLVTNNSNRSMAYSDSEIHNIN
ncbi:PREDICTED: patatin-like phospholipase domain-containing protein 7 isoform X2 [Amphimedon queenslandica]|uniref:lysophospholipase n=1 Tax=Amphimedon queenslandica TaxID=400682 RepID=A0AAN0J7B9_AMPQE|nr:PREDICTED: patatin-like phospholipase domain-containing protein 7 isoform X2 [Amphimedon queenslandica]|eukprot:XP_019852919.1 PREDICTED: patatin-like phospholipase domain-containing protein 7 isoform X2 [Amphimedon queenslandica]